MLCALGHSPFQNEEHAFRCPWRVSLSIHGSYEKSIDIILYIAFFGSLSRPVRVVRDVLSRLKCSVNNDVHITVDPRLLSSDPYQERFSPWKAVACCHRKHTQQSHKIGDQLWTFVAALGGNTIAFSLVESYRSVSPGKNIFWRHNYPFFYGVKTLNFSTPISTTGASREEIRCSMHPGMKIPHLLRRGTWGRPEHRNTAKKINEHRITARKVDETPSPQELFLTI